MRILWALCLLVVSSTLALAGQLTFEGQHFVSKFHATQNPQHQFLELGLSQEPLQSWTRLLTLHAFRTAGTDPGQAAANLIKATKRKYPGVSPRILTNEQTSEAMVVFTVSVPGSDVMEFNVFKYGRVPGHPGVVAAQFARRFRRGELSTGDVEKLQERSISAMARFNLGVVPRYLSKVR